ncbi:hypothetical protein SAMN05444008_116107 [Cnuella takakiae]|uniref:Uncharacterized protein n=1 Tax=Cnuella takakiae TaxID=1302690 RepID=A0A1M5GJK6_9BACT|nr:hypothetical protein [Cnuella takakiae]OLY92442.1 hypothetical protein BUE76_11500 [Cnuella takakiae]SHG03930.1 hypothetical protein SAMN05444008_116107 [Cnuella takakiae]
MALSSTSLQPVQQPAPVVPQSNNNTEAAALLSAMMLAAYAGTKGRKQLRKLQRKATWMVVKQKVRSVFRKDELSERQTIIYILLGIAILALLFAAPVAALVLAIIGLVLILTGTI